MTPTRTDLVTVLGRATRFGWLRPGPLSSQVDHSLAMAAFARTVMGAEPGVVADLGSGAGLPGLVLATEFVEAEVHLVERAVRRAAFLRLAVAELHLGSRVRVWSMPASEVGAGHLAGRVELVTARSFGPPAVVAECAAALLSVGGWCVVSEPPAATGTRWPRAAVAGAGFDTRRVETGPPAFVALRRSEQAVPSARRCRDAGAPSLVRLVFHVEHRAGRSALADGFTWNTARVDRRSRMVSRGTPT